MCSTVILDTTVLINFLCIERIDLLEKHSSDYIVTDHVDDEVSNFYPDQRKCFERALKSKIIKKISVQGAKELEFFKELKIRGLGNGECSAFALAISQYFIVGIDDNTAKHRAKSLAKSKNYSFEIQGTQDIMVSMIQEGLLDVSEADKIKEVWGSYHSFKLNFNSFSEIMPHHK